MEGSLLLRGEETCNAPIEAECYDLTFTTQLGGFGKYPNEDVRESRRAGKTKSNKKAYLNSFL